MRFNHGRLGLAYMGALGHIILLFILQTTTKGIPVEHRINCKTWIVNSYPQQCVIEILFGLEI